MVRVGRWIALCAARAVLCVCLTTQATSGDAFHIITNMETSCDNLKLQPGSTGRVYLSYGFGIGASMVSAQFRLAGLPAGWSAIVQKGPCIQSIYGDLCGSGATVVAVDYPQWGLILVATIDITAGTGSGELCAVPLGSSGPCTLDTLIPVRGLGGNNFFAWTLPLRLNAEQGCPTAVQSQTWSGVKSLFLE
jgi:hypothetical protein